MRVIRTSRKDRPSDRVRMAMRRLSRDVWLSPDDIRDVGVRLSRLAHPYSWAHVYKAAIPFPCEGAGMIRGEAPVWVGDRRYGDAVALAKKFNGKNRTEIMINLLRIVA